MPLQPGCSKQLCFLTKTFYFLSTSIPSGPTPRSLVQTVLTGLDQTFGMSYPVDCCLINFTGSPFLKTGPNSWKQNTRPPPPGPALQSTRLPRPFYPTVLNLVSWVHFLWLSPSQIPSTLIHKCFLSLDTCHISTLRLSPSFMFLPIGRVSTNWW